MNPGLVYSFTFNLKIFLAISFDSNDFHGNLRTKMWFEVAPQTLFVYRDSTRLSVFVFARKSPKKIFLRRVRLFHQFLAGNAPDWETWNAAESDTNSHRALFSLCEWKTGLLWLRHERLHRREGKTFPIALQRELNWETRAEMKGYWWIFMAISLIFSLSRARPRMLIE